MEVRTGVNVMGMSIEHMTTVSYLLFAVSGALAVSAAVMFVVLDIAKCWQMVSGRSFASRKRRKKTVAASETEAGKSGHTLTEKISRPEICAGGKKTLPLGSREDTVLIGQEAMENTVLLDCAGGQESQLRRTDCLEIIQDIAYMQDTGIL